MPTDFGPEITPLDFWEERYAGAERVWSGTPNRTLIDVVSGLQPGSALDLGCGEGSDVIWLAQRGWRAAGIDISTTAVARARAAASALGLDEERARFEAADLSTWRADGEYDLITAAFLQSPVALSRVNVLRAASDRIAPSGHLLVIAHAAPPPWSRHHHEGEGHGARDGDFLTPDEEIAALGLDPVEWKTVVAEVRSRDATGPEGQRAVLEDSVVLLQRPLSPQSASTRRAGVRGSSEGRSASRSSNTKHSPVQ